MAAVNDIQTQLNGLYKICYGDRLERIIPENAKAQQAIPFTGKGKIGKRYEKPVVVGLEQGITHAAPEAGAFTLDAPIAGTTVPTFVQAYQHVLRSRIAYDAAFQAPGSGKESFENATNVVFQNAVESIRRRLELDILGYSRSGFRADVAPGNLITIRTAEWAPGAFVGMEGAVIEAWDDNDFAADNPHVINDGQINYIDLDTRTLTVDDATGFVDGDYLYFKSMRTTATPQAMVGLDQIATGVSLPSNLLFGVDTTTWNLFKGLVVSAGGVDLSIDVVLRAQSKMAVRGVDGSLVLWVSPATYVNLNADLASLVRYDGNAGGKYEIGADSIKIKGPTGVVMIEAHPCVKEGEAFLFQPKLLMRSGPTDVTFNRAKMMGLPDVQDAMFFDMADTAAFEFRCYSSQFLYTWKPACVCKINNIVNS